MIASLRVALAWSGGKDSLMALEALSADPSVEIAGLLTTVTGAYDRISMHGVRRSLLHRQAKALGHRLWEVSLSPQSSDSEYEEKMRDALAELEREGVNAIAFGDLFLAEIRAYREKMLRSAGFEGVFPIWGRPTADLAREFIARGYRGVVVCVDPKIVPADFAGRMFDGLFLEELPPEVDPCGENGEFHTFVFAGPLFNRPVAFRKGDVVERQGFVFCDLIPQRTRPRSRTLTERSP